MPKKKVVAGPAVSTGKLELVSVEKKSSGLDAVLASAEVKRPKSKSPMLEIKEPIPGIIKKISGLKAALEDAKAQFEAAGKTLTDVVLPLYRSYIVNSFVNSVHITDGLADLLLTWKHAYSKIPLEQAGDIRQVVGEKYGELFKEVAKVEVRTEVMDNEALLSELIGKIGAENFAKYFSCERFIRPTERFTEERFRVLSKEQNEALDPLVKQYAAALKLR